LPRILSGPEERSPNKPRQATTARRARRGGGLETAACCFGNRWEYYNTTRLRRNGGPEDKQSNKWPPGKKLTARIHGLSFFTSGQQAVWILLALTCNTGGGFKGLAGSINCISFPPIPKIIYVVANNGGLWRTFVGGIIPGPA